MSKITDRQGVRLSKIDLLDSGNKGIKVEYESVEIKDGIVTHNTHKDDRKRPVQKELKELFAKLGEALLECSGHDLENLDKPYQKHLLNKTEVVGVTCKDEESFQIRGKLVVMSNKATALNTVLVKMNDPFEQFDDVIDIINDIKEEARLYMQGKKGATKEDIGRNLFMKKNKKAKEDEFDNLSEDDRNQYIEEAMKDTNLVVEYNEEGEKEISVKEEESEEPEEMVEEVVEMKKEDIKIPNLDEVEEEPEEEDDLFESVDSLDSVEEELQSSDEEEESEEPEESLFG